MMNSTQIASQDQQQGAMELPFAVDSSLSTENRGQKEGQRSAATSSSTRTTSQQQQQYIHPHNSTGRSIASSLAATGSRVAASVLGQWTATTTPSRDRQHKVTPLERSNNRPMTQQQQQQQKHIHQSPSTEQIDFTYVNMWETDEDNYIVSTEEPMEVFENTTNTTDPLGWLLNSPNQIGHGATTTTTSNTPQEEWLSMLQEAQQAAVKAVQAKQTAQSLQEAVDYHTQSAKLFHTAAKFLLSNCNGKGSMAESLLLLSQVQAKSSIALQKALKLRPSQQQQQQHRSSHAERLRETVRGALENERQADLSESTFLGTDIANQTYTAQSTTPPRHTPEAAIVAASSSSPPPQQQDPTNNPIDEMMKLERELKDMDMTLELGNSVASLDVTQQRNKMDGSFMVVPSTSHSSILWSPRTPPVNSVRARTNRVQSARPANHNHIPTTTATTPASNRPLQTAGSLESSWWGSSSTMASQVLTASILSNHHPSQSSPQQQSNSTNTKQLLRLMDSLKTLGDENAALLKRAEEAEAALLEARNTKKEMQRFKEEYGQRFAALRDVLKKLRKETNDNAGYEASKTEDGGTNVQKSKVLEDPVIAGSDYLKRASERDQLERQASLIKKLTAELKREKEDNRRKGVALNKYESFYREVKARSAQKKAAEKRREEAEGARGKYHA